MQIHAFTTAERLSLAQGPGRKPGASLYTLAGSVSLSHGGQGEILARRSGVAAGVRLLCRGGDAAYMQLQKPARYSS